MLAIDAAKLTQWATGSILAAVWLLLLFPAKRILFRQIKKRLVHDPLSWGQITVGALSRPVTLLILAGGLAIARHLLPMPERFGKIINVAPTILIVLAIVLALNRILVGLLTRTERNHAELRNYSSIAKGVIHAIVILLGVMVVLESLGISITPLIASLGVGSIAVALALQDTLASFFSGIYVLIDKPIETGHYIELEGGQKGFVEKVGWRSTCIRMLQDNVIIVPNTKIASSIIINYHRPQGEMAVLVKVGVHYNSDLEHVERVTCEVAKETMREVQGGVPEFNPFVRYNHFDASSINFTVIMRGKDFVTQYLITHEFIKRLHRRYKQEGIVIPYPIRTLIHET